MLLLPLPLSLPPIAASGSGTGTGAGTEELTFLVMELVEGEDLSERITRGPLPVDETIPIALQIAKRAFYQAEDMAYDKQFALMNEAFARLCTTEDAKATLQGWPHDAAARTTPRAKPQSHPGNGVAGGETSTPPSNTPPTRLITPSGTCQASAWHSDRKSVV